MIDQSLPDTPRHVVVLAHPDSDSFNAAVASTYCDIVRASGQEAILRDLYAMNFDPVLHADERPGRPGYHVRPDVAAELELVAGTAVLTLVYPIWFGTMPAILKGYVDRVLGSGVTPAAVQERAVCGPLSGARLVSFTSSAARAPWLAEIGQELSLRSGVDHYLEHSFAMKSSEHLHFGGMVEGFTRRFVDQNLQDVRDRARRVCAAVAADRHGAKAREAHTCSSASDGRIY